MYDGIEYRGFGQHTLWKSWGIRGVPVFEARPTNFTPHRCPRRSDDHAWNTRRVKRCRKSELRLPGDARATTWATLADGGRGEDGMDIRLDSCAKSFWLDAALVAQCRENRQRYRRSYHLNGERWLIWRSRRGFPLYRRLGWEQTQKKLGRSARQSDDAISGQPQVVNATGNPDVKFMHRLPAFHNEHTKVGREMKWLTA